MKKHVRFTLPLAIAAVLATGLCLLASVKAADETKMQSESKLSANDKKFVKKAFEGGLEEVELAKIANEKAKNEATKAVAERMITDHTKANEELMNIAKEEDLDLSKVHVKPANLSGADFDKEYLALLKTDHEKDIAMFEKEANDPGTKEDSDVKAFAKKMIPTLKEHLQMVEGALAKEK